MAVNLTGRAGRAKASSLLESSFAQFQADRGVVGLTTQLRRLRSSMDELTEKMTCDKGDFAEYAGLRHSLSELERGASRERAASRRAEALRSLSQLRRGDIIRVPSGRRQGFAVVLDAPDSPVKPLAPRGVRADGLLVLTMNHQVKHLSPTDFPVPVEPIDHVKIPSWFSPRSPKHRRDLGSTLRAKLEGKDLPRGRTSRAADSDEDSEIAALRRRLRSHPCHSCPDREEHARYAERYFRLQREAAGVERQVAGRSHVIARTFSRVCAVLDELGYLSGDTVTPDGQRLGRIYSELDLVAAESLRRGLWDGLNPAELAACVSVLTFESRSPDDASPDRLPKGPVREVLAEMTRTWAELDQLEKQHSLSFLREPDLGFVWAAYRWVRGAKLEDVLDSVSGLTPGDFVRSTKQLIDLLDQIAVAAGPSPASSDDGSPKSRGVATTARAAIDAMRRGVIAYTTVTE
jgi:ATP-dependent RNA helicase HelY